MWLKRRILFCLMVPFPNVFRLLLTTVLWRWVQEILVEGRENNVSSDCWKWGPFERKPVWLLLWQYCHWHHISPVIGWEKEMSLFKYFLIYVPTTPYGKMKFLPCCLNGTVRRHFIPNYGSCIMNNCTESPSATSWPACWACSVLFECHINKEMDHFFLSLTLCHFK